MTIEEKRSKFKALMKASGLTPAEWRAKCGALMAASGVDVANATPDQWFKSGQGVASALAAERGEEFPSVREDRKAKAREAEDLSEGAASAEALLNAAEAEVTKSAGDLAREVLAQTGRVDQVVTDAAGNKMLAMAPCIVLAGQGIRIRGAVERQTLEVEDTHTEDGNGDSTRTTVRTVMTTTPRERERARAQAVVNGIRAKLRTVARSSLIGQVCPPEREQELYEVLKIASVAAAAHNADATTHYVSVNMVPAQIRSEVVLASQQVASQVSEAVTRLERALDSADLAEIQRAADAAAETARTYEGLLPEQDSEMLQEAYTVAREARKRARKTAEKVQGDAAAKVASIKASLEEDRASVPVRTARLRFDSYSIPEEISAARSESGGRFAGLADAAGKAEAEAKAEEAEEAQKGDGRFAGLAKPKGSK